MTYVEISFTMITYHNNDFQILFVKKRQFPSEKKLSIRQLHLGIESKKVKTLGTMATGAPRSAVPNRASTGSKVAICITGFEKETR